MAYHLDIMSAMVENRPPHLDSLAAAGDIKGDGEEARDKLSGLVESLDNCDINENEEEAASDSLMGAPGNYAR